MPSPPDPAVDERFDELAALIRAARPRASDDLRERVRALAEAEPAPRAARRFRFPARRTLLVLAPAMLVAVVASAAIVGLTRGDSEDERFAGRDTPVQSEVRQLEPSQPTEESLKAEGATGAVPPANLPPSRIRAQDFRAELRMFVPNLGELSRATRRAMHAARSLGGFVVRAEYSAPGGKEGDSVLVVRVPVRRVQEAIVRFSGLGTIVAQHIQIEDLQRTLDRQSEAIAALRRTIATLEAQLEQPNLTDVQRDELRRRLLRAQDSLAARTNAREGTQTRAATARIALTLTTREQATPPRPDKPGDFERTLRDAASVLGKVFAWGLAGLIVAGPFLLLAIVAFLLGRTRRRRGEQRLLERS
jgi:Domain of unknown function (DUF4349)